jgi:hypothetical protein
MKSFTLFLFALLVQSNSSAADPVLTRSYDNGRNGVNTNETKLTPGLVASNGLKKFKSVKITDDDRVEAQPLFVPGLKIKNKKHNVVFVASMGNHVFAFDADAPENQDLLWVSPELGKPYNPIVKTDVNPINQDPNHHRETNVDLYGINEHWGILSTPVIDLDANQMYLTNWTEGSDPRNPVLLLHRIRLGDGSEIGQPQVLHGSLTSGGQPVRDARGALVELHSDQKQRAALLLSPLRGAHKTLFIGITGGEEPGDPHGWMVTVDVDTFQQTDAVPTTQQGFGGGIWQGAQGPSSDDKGNVYVMTGNGGFNARRKNGPDPNPGTPGDFNGKTDFGEAFVKFHYQKTAGGGKLTLDDWFIPFKDSTRNGNGDPDYQDQDLGSGSPILPKGTNLVFGAGKDGILYVLDRGHLGKLIGDFTVLKQNPPVFVTFNGLGLNPAGNIDFALGGGPDPPQGPPKKTHHLHASPVYFNGPAGPLLFDWGENESLRSWKVSPAGAVSFLGKSAEVASRGMTLDNSTGGMTGGMISLSSKGKNNGIVWTLAPVNGNANKAVVDGIVRAYDATAFDGTNADTTPKLKLLWDSTKAGVAFHFSKFCPPMIADGKLYVATYDGTVDVYTLNP